MGALTRQTAPRPPTAARTTPAARGLAAPTPATGILRLQRTVGNRAVRAVLRATLFAGLDATTRAGIQTATAPIVADKFDLYDFG